MKYILLKKCFGKPEKKFIFIATYFTLTRKYPELSVTGIIDVPFLPKVSVSTYHHDIVKANNFYSLFKYTLLLALLYHHKNTLQFFPFHLESFLFFRASGQVFFKLKDILLTSFLSTIVSS